MDNRNLNDFYDAIIIGGGPAGLSSAIYMARARYKTLVLEKDKFGGQITITSEVVNYPGVFKTSGTELTKEMQKQAEAFGAEFLLTEVNSFSQEGDYFVLDTDRGQFKTLGLIIAGGAAPRMVGFAGEEQFKGRGVAYCATCDGEFFSGKEIYVIGSGFAACEESIFLTRFATKVHMLIREPDFTCTGSIVNEVKAHPAIEINYNTTMHKVSGENFVTSLTINKDGQMIDIEDAKGIGVFVFAGYVPASAKFAEQISLNPQKYIITDANQKTNLDGVYAAGDICVKNLRQVVTATADGATAATSLEKHLAEQYEKLQLPTREYVKKEVVTAAIEAVAPDDGNFISPQIRADLQPVFERFENNLILKYRLDSSDLSQEVEGFIKEFSTINQRIICEEDNSLEGILPTIALYDEQGNYSGISFHGVPGGHEFNSFIIGLYNTQGSGQKIAEQDLAAICAIDKKIVIKLAVTLSCSNCPDLVIAAQKIAANNPNISLDIFDLAHFADLKDSYNIMSVPCMIINDQDVHFGKKNIGQILTVLAGI